MKVRFEKIEDFCSENFRAYTVFLNNEGLSEFEKFFSKDDLYESHRDEMEILLSEMEDMKEYSAESRQFKNEKDFHCLPRVFKEIKEANKNDFGIRLYCLFIRPSLVVFFNGDIKTVKGSAQECPQVGPHFKNAENIVRIIETAHKHGFLDYDSDNPFEYFDQEY